MLEREFKALRKKLQATSDEVQSHHGPTVPPQNMPRRWMVGQLAAALDDLDALAARLAPILKPDYSSPEPKK